MVFHSIFSHVHTFSLHLPAPVLVLYPVDDSVSLLQNCTWHVIRRAFLIDPIFYVNSLIGKRRRVNNCGLYLKYKKLISDSAICPGFYMEIKIDCDIRTSKFQDSRHRNSSAMWAYSSGSCFRTSGITCGGPSIEADETVPHLQSARLNFRFTILARNIALCW